MNVNPVQQNPNGTWSVGGNSDPITKAATDAMVKQITDSINKQILQQMKQAGFYRMIEPDEKTLALIYINLGEDNYPDSFSFINQGGLKRLYAPDYRASMKYTDRLWLVYDITGKIEKISDDPNSIYYKCTVIEYKLNEDLVYVRVQKERWKDN